MPRPSVKRGGPKGGPKKGGGGPRGGSVGHGSIGRGGKEDDLPSTSSILDHMHVATVAGIVSSYSPTRILPFILELYPLGHL